jgi:hypothetical protein
MVTDANTPTGTTLTLQNTGSMCDVELKPVAAEALHGRETTNNNNLVAIALSEPFSFSNPTL